MKKKMSQIIESNNHKRKIDKLDIIRFKNIFSSRIYYQLLKLNNKNTTQ